MKPTKLATPTFAVTAAVVGGMALAVTTCQAQGAVLRKNPSRALPAGPESRCPLKTRRPTPGHHPGGGYLPLRDVAPAASRF